MPDVPGNCDLPPGRSIANCGTIQEELSLVSHQDGVIPHTGPINPQYASLAARISSYKEWPPGLKQTPDTMAEAGLYYYGISDQVKCFYCDGGLKEWQAEDDPWVEHAGWFSECAFVRLVRGDEFVEESAKAVRNVVVKNYFSKSYFNTSFNVFQETRREKMKKTEQDKVSNGIKSDSGYNSSSSSVADDELLRTNEKLKEQMQCKVCMDRDVGVVFIPCGHLVTCTRCAPGLSKCAVCRKIIQSTVRVYMA